MPKSLNFVPPKCQYIDELRCASVSDPELQALVALHDEVTTSRMFYLIEHISNTHFKKSPAFLAEGKKNAILKVVEGLHANFRAVEPYTRVTDFKHYSDVAGLVETLKPDADINLIIAAWFHDIERWFELVGALRRNKHDGSIRKKLVHPWGSVLIAKYVLDAVASFSFDHEKIDQDKVLWLIQYHDAGLKGLPPYLPSAQASSFLLAGPDRAREWVNDLVVLSEADGLAFFKNTLSLYINYRKEAKEEDYKIIDRVRLNYNKITPMNRTLALSYAEENLLKKNLHEWWFKLRVVLKATPLSKL